MKEGCDFFSLGDFVQVQVLVINEVDFQILELEKGDGFEEFMLLVLIDLGYFLNMFLEDYDVIGKNVCIVIVNL